MKAKTKRKMRGNRESNAVDAAVAMRIRGAESRTVRMLGLSETDGRTAMPVGRENGVVALVRAGPLPDLRKWRRT
jgi:hypothetical protein